MVRLTMRTLLHMPCDWGLVQFARSEQTIKGCVELESVGRDCTRNHSLNGVVFLQRVDPHATQRSASKSYLTLPGA